MTPISNKAQRMIGYVRGSTSGQGLTLSAQQTMIENAAQLHNWTLVEVIRDKGQSAKDLDRPGLLHALNMILGGEADGLVVAKLDRISRSVVDFGRLLEWFEDAGASLVALDFALDTSTPSGRLVANVLLAVAQWEREAIAARTKDALAARKAEGRPSKRPSVALAIPEVAERIRTERADGRTWQAIADGLNADEIPTVRGGAEWRVSSVQSAAGYVRPAPRRKRGDLPEVPRRNGRRL